MFCNIFLVAFFFLCLHDVQQAVGIEIFLFLYIVRFAPFQNAKLCERKRGTEMAKKYDSNGISSGQCSNE